MKKIKVVRTITFLSESPYDEQSYPNMSVEEAIEFEKNLSFEEFLDMSLDPYEGRVTVIVVDE